MNVSTDRLRTLLASSLLCVTGAVMAVPATAPAQEKQSPRDSAPAKRATKIDSFAPRFSETFTPAGTTQKVRFQVEPAGSEGEWEVHVITGDDPANRNGISTKLREALPRWVADDHYGFEVVSASLGDGVTAVLLAALPGIHGDSPPSATQLQLVWIVEKRRGKLRWKRLETAQYSPLDGGERFEFQKKGKSHQLVRRRRGSDSLFCGDSAENPIIFDLYDTQTREFEQTLDIDHLVKEAPVVKASRGSETFNPPSLQAWYQWFAASSDRRSPNRRGALIRPLELGDGKIDTGWMEGAESLGRGEFVSSQINDAVALHSMRIVPGLGGDERLFKGFARPTRLLVGLSDGSRFVVELGEIDYEQVRSGKGVIVELPEPTKTRCMSVMLLDAKRGKVVKNQPGWTRATTTIAEITPYSELHADDGAKTARRLVEAISNEKNPRARQRIAELSLSIEKYLIDEVRRAVNEGDAEKRRRIIPLMASLPADEAVPMLIQFLRETNPTAPEYRAVKRSLAAHYAKAAPALVKFLAEDSKEQRKQIDVLRLLGRVGEPTHLVGLIDGLGQGQRAVRNERIRALGAGGQSLVEPLLLHANQNVDTDAGYDALRALNLLGKRLYYTDQGELPQPEVFGQLLQNTKKRRSLMRALEVAKFFHSSGFVETTRDTFSSHKDALVRRVAIEALERYPSAVARQVLVAALADRSPDVRIAAVSALGQRDDVATVIDAVLEYSQKERWKAGLKQAFRVLATVDTPATTAAFEARFRDAPNKDASLWAAQALDRAHRPVRAELAQSLIEDPDVGLELRLEMLDLLGLDSSERGESFLLDTLDQQRWTEFAEATRARQQLRDRVMLSVGRRRSRQGMSKLLAIAQSAGETDIRQVALRSLAFYRDEELLAQLELWKQTADPELQSILDQTITMIERRRSLSSAQSDIDEVLEQEEEDKSESSGDNDASNDTSSEER